MRWNLRVSLVFIAVNGEELFKLTNLTRGVYVRSSLGNAITLIRPYITTHRHISSRAFVSQITVLHSTAWNQLQHARALKPLQLDQRRRRFLPAPQCRAEWPTQSPFEIVNRFKFFWPLSAAPRRHRATSGHTHR